MSDAKAKTQRKAVLLEKLDWRAISSCSSLVRSDIECKRTWVYRIVDEGIRHAFAKRIHFKSMKTTRMTMTKAKAKAKVFLSLCSLNVHEHLNRAIVVASTFVSEPKAEQVERYLTDWHQGHSLRECNVRARWIERQIALVWIEIINSWITRCFTWLNIPLISVVRRFEISIGDQIHRRAIQCHIVYLDVKISVVTGENERRADLFRRRCAFESETMVRISLVRCWTDRQ